MGQGHSDQPANTISDEELEAFYAKMGIHPGMPVRASPTSWMTPKRARQMALDGADWEDVVKPVSRRGRPPGRPISKSPFPSAGYNPDFEKGVYNTEIGGITPVIHSVYGYWVLKVLEEKPGNKPALEEAKAQILDMTYNRKLSHLKDEFKKTRDGEIPDDHP